MASDPTLRRPKYVDIVEEEFGAALGAKPTASSEKLSFFVAHKDKAGVPVPDIESWITRVEKALSDIGGGATSMEVRGAWVGGPNGVVHETTTLVYTYAQAEAIEAKAAGLRELAWAYGTTTNQGEVGILLENNDGDWFYSIPMPD